MVWHEQRSTVSRSVIGAVFTMAMVCAPAARGQAPAPKFYADDPLLREPAPHAVKQVARRDVDDLYDFLDNSFVTPRKEGKVVREGPHTAGDPNTLGDVPDNAWYTNRHYYHRMSIEELKRGPGNSTPPSAGTWRIISAKTNGVTPGFVIEDDHKNRYVLKLDPPQYPEMASAADVIGSKALYALGYNTPENYIVHFRRENLVIAEGVTWRDAGGTSCFVPNRREKMAPTAEWRAVISRVNWPVLSVTPERGATTPTTSFPTRTGVSCVGWRFSRRG